MALNTGKTDPNRRCLSPPARSAPQVDVSLDWLSFSFDKSVDLDFACTILNIDQRELFPARQMLGFDTVLKHFSESFYIMYGNQGSNVIHFECSGKSMNWLISLFNADIELGIIDLSSNLASVGHATRLDLALDDVNSSFFDMCSVKRLFKHGRFVGQYHQWSINESHSTDGSMTGCTVYLGSRTSSFFGRIYDKLLETKSKLPDNSYVPATTRFELEIKHDQAEQVFKRLPSIGIRQTVLENWSYFHRFTMLDDSNKSRCSVLPAWLKFLDHTESWHVTVSKKILPIDQRAAWLDRQCGDNMAIVELVNPGFLKSTALSHANTLDPAKKALIDANSNFVQQAIIKY